MHLEFRVGMPEEVLRLIAKTFPNAAYLWEVSGDDYMRGDSEHLETLGKEVKKRNLRQRMWEKINLTLRRKLYV